MNIVHMTIGVALLALPVLGCIITGQPRKNWDFQSSKEDMDLTIKEATASTPEEKRYYEDSKNDLRYGWHIDLDNTASETPLYDQMTDKDREKAVNRLIDKTLSEGRAKPGGER